MGTETAPAGRKRRSPRKTRAADRRLPRTTVKRGERMTAPDEKEQRTEFEQLFRDFVAGKLSRRHFVAGGAALGAGAALVTAGGVMAAPGSIAPRLRGAFQEASPTPK